ncbi:MULTISPECIES: hypothetical protein [Streptomyces]|uniref:hypothetical protein n=1 Tax=Streptomyces TaxID=1883 RepID=UPI00368A154C
MNTIKAFELMLNNPTMPFVFGVVLIFALLLFAKVYTLHLALRGAKPAERPAIMREHKNMWQVRHRRRY